MTMLSFSAFFLAALPASSLTADACAAVGKKDIVETAREAGSFRTLLTAVEAAGLVDTLKGEGPFTVFAPSDEAFAKLPEGMLKSLLKDTPQLKKVLTYHVAAGRLPAAKVVESSWIKTVQGQSARIEVAEGEVRIDGARIAATDIEASNGIIHVIDAVILPREKVLGTAAKAGKFKTLLAAVEAAGLRDTLEGEGPFTVFAPSDAAFEKLAPGTVESLLADVPKLQMILKYHVVPGRVLASQVAGGEEGTKAATVEGRKLQIRKTKDGGIQVGSTQVVATDVLAGNGVIHVIDAVLMP